MAEGTKVRVVRCPKCENLLPELPDFPVYQCGGCGAVLGAKKQTPASDGTLEKSDEERIREDFEKLEVSPEKVKVDLSDTSETERNSEGLMQKRGRRERFVQEKGPNLNSSSSSRTEHMEGLSDQNDGRGVETMESRYDRRNLEKDSAYGGVYRRPSKAPVENLVVADNLDLKMNRDELAKAYMEKEIGEIKQQMGNGNGFWRAGQFPVQRAGEGDGSSAFRRPSGAVVEGVRSSISPYSGEGPSNYPGISPYPGISYGYKDPIRNPNDGDGPNRVEYLEKDRAELLRKLEELKDQLSMADKSKERERPPVDRKMVPPDPYGVHDNWFMEGPSGSNRASVLPHLQLDKHVPGPPYLNHSHDAVPLMNRHDLDMHNFYPPPMHASNEIPRYGYGDPLGPQMLRRAHHQPPHQYPLRPSHEYYSRGYADIDPDFVTSYPQNNTFFHQPACSCLHCYNKQWQIPAQGPPPVYYNRRYPDAPNNPMFYPHEDPMPIVSQGYNRRAMNPPPLHSHEPARTRRPSDLDSEMVGFGRGHLQRVVLANRNGRRCRPIAGGAPFITCSNCFEVLQLPKKPFLSQENQRKLRCGACSTVISFVIENQKFVVLKQIPVDVDDGSVEVIKAGLLHSNGYANRGSINSSEDYDNSGYNFQSTDTEPILSSKDQGMYLSESEKMLRPLSSSSTTSEDDEIPDHLIARGGVSNSEEMLPKANMTPPLPGSPLHENVDNSSDHVVNRLGKGNRSKRSDQEKVAPNKGNLRQNSLKDASMATEMEVSFNEYSNPGLSQDSGEVTSREEDRPRVSKGGESFFAGLIKKSFKDFSRSNQTVESGKASVFINGQPISDRLVKKAEKLAGPIQPGQYWYDFRAGFWGVMGLPCVGIIPPFIEEFYYPMPKNCAGGNTGVVVNGRELHQRDLDLLATRGLPTDRDKSYIIEISGKVLDEDTGEEIDSLGKLAPTVEKVKHGFGMKVPRMAA